MRSYPEVQWRGRAENAIVLKLVKRKTQSNTVTRIRERINY